MPLTSGGVEITPSTVNQISVFKVYSLIQNSIPQNGFIKVTFPQGITNTPSSSCFFTSPQSVGVSCSYSITTDNLIQLTAKVSSQVKDYFELNIQNFKNPSTTSRTSSFTIYTYDAQNNLLDYQDDQITLQATPDTLQSLSLQSSSSRVGDTNQELTVSLQAQNEIPKSGKIYVQFPYWNPDASGTQYSLQSYLSDTTNINCVGLSTNIASGPPCSFDTDSQLLTLQISNGNPISSGSSLSFKIKNFKNPITTQTISGFVVSTGDALVGLIDQSQATIRMTTVGLINSAKISIDNSTVQEITKYRLDFKLPIPLSLGCIMEIQFPIQIPLESSILTQVQGFGLPSTQRILNGNIDTSKNSYVYQQACPTYRDNSNSAIIYFTNIRNPTYQMTTNSIEIYFYDQNNNMLCSTSGSGPTVTTVPGNLIIQGLTSDVTEINSLGSLTFTIQPLHRSAANSQIIITLPSNQLKAQSQCTITSLQTISDSAECSTSGNIIIIKNAFSIAYSPSSSKVIQFKISQIKLPPSIEPLGNLQVSLYTSNNGVYYLVDQGSASNLLTATNGILSFGQVSSTSLKANDVTSYTISFRVKNPIIQNGYVVITLPKELSFQSSSSQSCSNPAGYQNSLTCSFTSSTVKIYNAFQNQDFTSLTTTLSVQISGIMNPRSISTTSSFSISTYSSTGYMIDTKNDQMTVTMTDTNPVTSATVIPYSTTVGATTIYTFKITSPTQLINGDKVLIQFPANLSQPLSDTLTACNGNSTNMASNLNCLINGLYGVSITLQFSKSPLAANTEFALSVKSVANPSTTETTSKFTAEIQDSQSFQINKNNPNLVNFNVKMVQGAKFKTITVNHQSSQAFVMTAFVFSFKLENDLPSGAQIQITYPSQITVDESQFGCSVSTFSANPQCSLDAQNRIIYLRQVTNTLIKAGNMYSITIQGLINSKKASSTDSFTLQTMTPDGYIINYANTGLTVSNDCDYPCLTCISKFKPNQCTSCDIKSNYNLLLNNSCVETCPISYYPTNTQCLACDSSCASCKDGPKNCTKCADGLFFQGSTCVSQCVSNQYVKNNLTMNCDKCASPCATCSGSINTCTSCLPNIASKFYFQNSCISICPIGYIGIDGSCVKCDSNCRSCSLNTTICDTCNYPLKLNKLDMTCVQTCPAGITVDNGNYCDNCNPLCKTCDSLSPSKCYSCNSGLSYYDKENSCLSSCPSGTIQEANSNGDGSFICKSCATGCSACQINSDYCTKCDDSQGYLFYQFKCVKDKCPSGFTRLSKERNICVREGYVCPYGYDFNDYGECDLQVQICNEGYMLNKDKTKCIPIPGAYVPMIFVIVGLAWTLFIVIKYLSMFVANIAFTLYFHIKLRKEDPAFKHWYTEHKKTYTFYKFAMSIFNFKIARGFYSKLFVSKPYFNAAFENKYQNIVKPLFYTTVVNFLLQVMPVVVMDIYNFIFIPWGYQLMVSSIDNIILAIVIFILEIIEFRYYKKLAYQEGNLMRLQQNLFRPKQQNYEENVMNVIDDNNIMNGIKEKGYREEISIGEDGSLLRGDLNPGRKSNQFKRGEDTEKQLLEKLVRKLNEEQKFNQIYDDEDDEEQQPQQNMRLNQQEDGIVKTDPKRRQSTDDSGANLIKLKKQDDAREKIENRLSFRTQQRKIKQSTLQQKIYADLQYPVFSDLLNQSDILGNQTLDMTDQKLLSEIEEQNINLESARTEKFQHQLVIDDFKSGASNTKLQLSKDQDEIPEKDESQDAPNPLEATRNEVCLNATLNYDSPRQNQEVFEKFKEEFIEKLKKREKELQPNERDWESCDDNIMREWYDDLGPESDYDPDEISHESYPHHPMKLQSADYLAKLELFRELLKSKYQYNNCYTHNTDPYNKLSIYHKQSKNITRRTQTYERDIGIGYDPFAKEDLYLSMGQEEFFPEIQQDYAQNLINNIIEQLSEEESFIEMKRDLIPEEAADSEDTDFDFEKIKRSKKRKRDVQFDLDDIMGMFDIDDFGNIMLNRDTMRDNLNRKVNKNGYLIDNLRNIINQDGDIIFEVNELDEDEEIPLPYRFEKRKKQLLKQEERYEVQTEKNYDLDSILLGEEEKIEAEFQKLKDMSRPSSMDSLMGEMPVKLDTLEQDDENYKINTELLNLSDQNEEGQSRGNLQSSATKREKQLAKAYGGKPPKAKKKKKNNKKTKKGDQGDANNNNDRLPTDRMFPFLMQEEERVKRLAMIQFGIQNNTTVSASNAILKSSFQKPNYQQQQQQLSPKTQNTQENTNQKGDFEQFFKQQMQEIQQFRQNAQEEYKQKIGLIQSSQVRLSSQGVIVQGNEEAEENKQQEQQRIDFYQDATFKNAQQRIDSATTDKHHLYTNLNDLNSNTINNNKNEGAVNIKINNNNNYDGNAFKLNEETMYTGQDDPMQDLIQQDAERVNKFFLRIKRENTNKTVLINYNNQNQNAKQQQYPPRQKPSLTQLNQTTAAVSNLNLNMFNTNHPQSALSMSSIPYQQVNEDTNLSIQGYTPQENNFVATTTVNQNNFYSNNQQSLNPSSQQQTRKFDFYLPVSGVQAKVKKNLQKDKEKKDISFSNIGRMQLHGNSNNAGNETGKIKGLEKVYLQKYPMPPKTSQAEQRPTLQAQAIFKRRGPGGQGAFRTNSINDQQTLQNPQNNYQPFNTFYGENGQNQLQNNNFIYDNLSNNGFSDNANSYNNNNNNRRTNTMMMMGNGYNQDL